MRTKHSPWRPALAGLVLLAGALMAGVPAIAHHSLTAEFDTNARITLRGPVTKMEWVNPHIWLHLDVKGADGRVVNWSVEGSSPNSLVRRGLTKNSLPVGTDVVVQAYLSRQRPDSVAHGTSVLGADGKELYLGASTDSDPDR